MCNYMGYEFGAGRYPDSVCIDGKLYDADNCDDAGNLYDPGEDMPCPMCHPRKAIRWWTERNSYGSDDQDDKKAAANAISLVRDIRKNRGVHSLRSNTEGQRP